MANPLTPNTQIRVRRLPGLPGQQKMQFESLEGKILWTAPLDERISNILNGRWTCTLHGYFDGRQMEILGEAPEADLESAVKPPHTLRLTED